MDADQTCFQKPFFLFSKISDISDLSILEGGVNPGTPAYLGMIGTVHHGLLGLRLCISTIGISATYCNEPNNYPPNDVCPLQQ
jgi:hypothetical protein